MHRDVLDTLLTITPTTLSNPETSAMLSAWQQEVDMMVRLARHGKTWKHARPPVEREAFLGVLVAAMLTDLVQTVSVHTTVCRAVTAQEPASQDQAEGEADGPAPEAAVDDRRPQDGTGTAGDDTPAKPATREED